jgi:Spx/MgsR family transcriptional regulator
MNNIRIYGIKSCSTMKKALTWLEEQGIAFEFQDYKKQPIDQTSLEEWLTQQPWDLLINKRGTTWRKLEESDKADIDNAKAIKIMLANNSIIKRPILSIDGKIHLGFKDADYEQLFQH